MPDGSAPRIVPAAIECRQHGGMWPVTAQRILEHEDGTRHVYAVATCGKGSLPRHEFAEHIRPAG